MVYPALLPLLPLMRTPQLPAVDWTDAPANLNGLVRFAETPNLFSAHMPSRFERAITQTRLNVALCGHCLIIEPECVYCAVRSESLYIIQVNLDLQTVEIKLTALVPQKRWVVTFYTTRFHVQKFYVQPPSWIYVLCMDIRKKRKKKIISVCSINRWFL